MSRPRISMAPAYEEQPQVAAFVSRLPALFDTEGTVLHDKRNTIKRFGVGDHVLVTKRFGQLSLPKRLIYTWFRKTKALRSFLNAGELLVRGIETPQPVACVETRRWGLVDRCYYVCAVCDDAPIRRELIEPAEFNRSLAAGFAAFCAQLHENGVLHGDLNSTNVLFRRLSDGRFGFSLIDLNRMKFLPLGQQPTLSACAENLTRFCGRMDLFRFVAGEYAKCREMEPQKTVDRLVRTKQRHDQRWQRRKRFLRHFKIR